MTAHEGTPERVGNFRVLRRVATGGTSDVLLARAEGPHGFERPVVLKLLLSQFRDDASFERMFAREAAAYARLSHPAIVKLYDFFADRGQLVMVLEHVDGLPLNKLRALLRQHGLDLDDRASLFIASRIFSALAAAHAATDPQTGEFAPVIHRDVNPSNVLIPWDGHVKLADFGIAKVAGIQGDTQAGYIKGTYGYMAPEQVRGEHVTPRTDVYAATLLLWELLTRRKAIQRGALPEMEVLRAMAEPQLPSIDVLRPDLPPQLRDAIKRALEPNVDKRAIFADELVAVLRGSANLEEGRAVLAASLAAVRPPPSTEDLEKTLSMPPDLPPDTEVGMRDALASDTDEVPALIEPVPVVPVAAPKVPLPPLGPPPQTKRATPPPPPARPVTQPIPRPPSPPPPPVAPITLPMATPPPPPAYVAPPAFTPPSAASFAPAPPPSPVPNAVPVVLDAFPPLPPDRPRISAGMLGAIVGLSVASTVLIVGLLWIRTHPRGEAPRFAAPAPSAAPVAAPSLTATPPATAAPIPSSDPSAAPAPVASPADSGDVDTSGTRPDHRIWVDGRVLGQTPATVRVKCGKHAVKLGSHGSTQWVDVPCGGSAHVGDR